MNKKQFVLFLLSVFFIAMCTSTIGKVNEKDKFPGRDIYPEVTIYELTELYEQKDEVVIVDVRSSYEFETLRAKDALNLPVSSKNFVDDLRKLRASTNKPIVFYCNGRTCYKSYKAVRKANYNKIENCFSFDSGIFDWAKKYPDEAILLGRNPVNITDLISKASFKKKLIAPDKFGESIGPKTIVLDVRDPFQREGISFFPGQERRVPLDKKRMLAKYFKKAKRENKTLLIYDAVGKQVRWLMYSLERANIRKYYFMKGGADGYYKMLADQQWKRTKKKKKIRIERKI